MDVCLDRPVLSLDRPFTYAVPEDLEVGTGSLVSVPFHGRSVHAYVLGPAGEVPDRILSVRKVLSPVRFFDAGLLVVLRWVSERYVAPLASVIARSHPPRVASEEDSALGAAALAPQASPHPTPAPQGPPPFPSGALAAYRVGPDLLEALRRGRRGAFLVRPAPEEEGALVVEAVGACLAGGRNAIVLVPEAEPVPATARLLREAFGDRVAMFLGGDRRQRYRTWLELRSGRYGCVVGTRPAVFAPLARLGLVWVARESHAGHREERAPYYHVRDVALARARLQGAVGVMAALCPSAEGVVVGAREVARSRRAWPPVEVVRPGPEGRASRLVSALRSARRAFLYQPLPGYGVARVCRSCGEPATCARCGGVLRLAGGRVSCAVCGTDGACASCGGTAFGIVRGGAERVEEWVRTLAAVPVRRVAAGGPFDPPGEREITVGGPEAVKDHGPVGLDLVGILDADLAARRPGLSAMERALAVWMEAAGWARPAGRVIVQATRPGDPAVQALVTGNPERFYRVELGRRVQAGFPPGHPVFRVAGGAGLEAELRELSPTTLLASGEGDETVCLVTVRPEDVEPFGRAVRALAAGGTVSRVEAEPHL